MRISDLSSDVCSSDLLTHDLSNGGALLADGNIDAVELLALIVALIGGLLVDEGVDGDSGLAGLAVADDQLALTAADGNQRVNGLEAGLYRLMPRLARNDARRFLFDAHALRRLDRALAIYGFAPTAAHAAPTTLPA